MDKNTSQLWDVTWDKEVSFDSDIRKFEEVRRSIRWKRIEEIVTKEFGSISGLKIIEIGSGLGSHGAVMASLGAEVTVLDYSEIALKRAREFFKRNDVSAEFMKQNALNLSEELINKYDVSISVGLTEHFIGDNRARINKAHFDVLKNSGLAFIAVPNRYNPFYRIFKLFAEKTGRWGAGEEYPYSRGEFRSICRRIGVTEYSFIGDSLYWSFNFVHPIRVINKLLGLRMDVSKYYFGSGKGTVLDQYFSYSLVLCGKKS